MQILLLNLPWRKNGRFGVRAGSRWPFTSLPESDGYIHYIPFPFFLAYATSLLKSKGKKARLIDAIAEGMDAQQLRAKIKANNPAILVIETSTPSFNNDMRIAEQIYNDLDDCRIVMCGPHPSVYAEQMLEKYAFIDYILIGEYEYTLLNLVESLEKDQTPKMVKGLAYRVNKRIQVNPPRATIDSLDDLPWPERDDVPIYKYNDGFAQMPTPNVQMWASRGCPYSCTFCLWPQTIYKERRYRKRDVKDVIDEMEYLTGQLKFKAIYFDDDVFNIDRNYVISICDKIKNRKIKIPWAAMARADLIDEELLSKMAAAGLYAIKYGIESIDKKILNFCQKGIDINKTCSAIEATKRQGIKVHLTFCLGLPGETEQTLQKTLKFIEYARPDSFQFSLATPFPGTEYFKYAEDKGWLLSKKWSDYDGNYKSVVRTENLKHKDLERIMCDLNSNLNVQ